MYATPPTAIHHALPPKPVFNNVSHNSPSPVATQSPSPQFDASSNITYSSFCLPLSIIPGPNREDVEFATTGAKEKWLHPQDSPDQPPHALPVYQTIIEDLKAFCKQQIEADSALMHAEVTVSEPKHNGFRGETPKRGMVVGISLVTYDMVHAMKVRGQIIRATPVAMVRSCKCN
jgi:hypothetical protein